MRPRLTVSKLPRTQWSGAGNCLPSPPLMCSSLQTVPRYGPAGMRPEINILPLRTMPSKRALQQEISLLKGKLHDYEELMHKTAIHIEDVSAFLEDLNRQTESASGLMQHKRSNDPAINNP